MTNHPIYAVKWFALIPAANEDQGGDNQRVYAQTYFWWPSQVY